MATCCDRKTVIFKAIENIFKGTIKCAGDKTEKNEMGCACSAYG